ncbi:MAG: twin-arginine translocation signal domain-containing protein, partial [Abditibacteriaceae bacterium]
MKIERREFLKQSALALGTLALGPVVWRNNSYADDAVRNTNGTAPKQGTKLAAAQGAKQTVYFFENFRNYGTKAPTVVDDSGISLYNEAIFDRKAAIDVNLSQASLVLREYSPANPPANLLDYDVLFQFRLQENNGKLGNFQLRLHSTQKGKTGDVIVGISSDEIKISSDGLNPAVTGGAKLPFTIEKYQWHQAALTVRNGELTVFIDNDRELKAVAQAKMLGLSSAGINFYGFQGSPFSLTDIMLRAPAPLPNNAIANIMPAPFTVNEADFKRGITQSVAVNDIFGATIRTGLEQNAVKLTINNNDGTSRDVTFTVLPSPEKRPDAIIHITGLSDAKPTLDYYIRPFLRRYQSDYSFTDTYHDIVRDWDSLPKASEHPLKVELRRTAPGA